MTVRCNRLFGVTRFGTPTLRMFRCIRMKKIPRLAARDPHVRRGLKPARIIETPCADSDEVHPCAGEGKQRRTTVSAERTRRRAPACGDYFVVFGLFPRKPKIIASYYDRGRICRAARTLTVPAVTVHHRARRVGAFITDCSTGTPAGES